MVKTVSNGCFTSNLASVAPRFRGEMLRVWVYTRASSSYATKNQLPIWNA